MKLIILKNNLLKALSIVEHAIGTSTNLPILKDVLIRSSENKIEFISTNLELAIRNTVSGKILEEGECAVPFAVLFSIIKNLNTERVTFEKKDGKLLLGTENYEATLQVQDAAEFPIIPEIHHTEQSIRLPLSELREALGKVIVATQYSEIRPEISGVFFRISEGFLTLAATDSFRLAEYIIPQGKIQSSYENVSFILPMRSAEEFLRISDGEDAEVEFFIDSSQILFVTPLNRFISRLIDGTFPEYQAIFPKQMKSEILVNRQELMYGIKLVSSLAGRAYDIMVTAKDGEKFLELSSQDSAMGENHYRTPIKLKGDSFSLVFNWRYLMDGLKITEGNEIEINVSAHGPVLIKDPSISALRYLAMPIKV